MNWFANGKYKNIKCPWEEVMKNSLKNGAKAQILGLAIFVLAGGMPAYGQSEAAEEGRTKLEEIVVTA